MASLNVIALISGGKDSLFSILHCLKNGHIVIALANLHPPTQPTARDSCADDASEEDMDSFMYQTVGHSIIPLYGEALALPLYRRPITGTALQTGQYYASTQFSDSTDETEDLIVLLEDVKRRHPEANAVCTGAILSTYQRTRVESVANRLGLTPLSYLWQYPVLPPPLGRSDSDVGLLQDMHTTGCDARLIKLASGGLSENMMWCNVADTEMQNRLMKAMRRFVSDSENLRGAVLGEGGEYETLAISGPPVLWKKTIHIDDGCVNTVIGEGGTSYARISGARLVPSKIPTNDEMIIPQPTLLDPQFSRILENYRNIMSAGECGTTEIDALANDTVNALSYRNLGCLIPRLGPNTHTSGSHIAMVDVTAPEAGRTAENQMIGIVRKVKDTLLPSNIVSTLLLISNMDHFAAVNASYSRLFRAGEPNPPARVTIAADLPPEIRISLSLLLDSRGRSNRKGLHVQSRSYWAPANIGPYSQAVCEPLQTDSNANLHEAGLPEVVHIAGQIPLVPSTMELLDESFCYQTILSLQHLWRTGQERRVDVWPWMVGFLAVHSDVPTRAQTLEWVLRQAHESSRQPGQADEDEEEDSEQEVDVWHQRFNHKREHHPKHDIRGGHHLHALPNKDVSDAVPPLVVAEVVSLPRNAPVEWWSMGLAHLTTMDQAPKVSHQTVRTQSSLVRITSIQGAGAFVTILVECGLKENSLQAIITDTSSQIGMPWKQIINGTAFVATADPWLAAWPEGVACIPCRSVYSSLGGDDSPVEMLEAAVLLWLE